MKRILILLIAVSLFHSPETVFQLGNILVSKLKHRVSPRNTDETPRPKPIKIISAKEIMEYAPRYKGGDRETFFDSLFAMSERLAFQPEWVLKTMFHESGLDPKARNSIGAAGLIQFKPETAVSLGTTTADLLKMSGPEQLAYIEKFWLPAKGKIGSYADLRLYNVFPAALGKGGTYILESPELPASVVAKRNPVFDTDGDSAITVHEFKAYVENE